MIIAIQGCAHGQLDAIYSDLLKIQAEQMITIDLLLCCGDFQAVRNYADLDLLKCPAKYKTLGKFKQYSNKQKKAPILTIFIGGNHQAVGHSRQLYFGGWVAQNIYYMGNSNILQVSKGDHRFTLGGISGIFNYRSFWETKTLETLPFDYGSMISAYHTKQYDVFKLLLASELMSQNLNVFLSHDWPAGIQHSGDIKQLLRLKPFFQKDIKTGNLGNPPLKTLIQQMCPNYWFSAHLHVKYAALVNRPKGVTRFLALDKCQRGRQHIQILKSWDKLSQGEVSLETEPTWLKVSKVTMDLMHSQQNLFQKGYGVNKQIFERKKKQVMACTVSQETQMYGDTASFLERIGEADRLADFFPNEKEKNQIDCQKG